MHFLKLPQRYIKTPSLMIPNTVDGQRRFDAKVPFDPTLGDGEFQLQLLGDGMALACPSGVLNDDLTVELELESNEFVIFCSLKGNAWFRWSYDGEPEHDACIYEKCLIYSAMNRTCDSKVSILIRGNEPFRMALLIVDVESWKRNFGRLVSEMPRTADTEPIMITAALAEVYSLFMEMCDGKVKNPDSRRVINCSNALRIAAHLIENEFNVQKGKLKLDEYEEMLISNIPNRMMRDVLKPPTLQELARELGMSPTKLKTSFKAINGEPIYTVFRKQKLKTAFGLLANTDLSIREIAFQCGYLSQSQFCDAFRREYNMTPSDLRRKKA